jgi:hypothetical protein
MTGRTTRSIAAAVGMTGFLLLAVGSRAEAQIAYVPGIGFIPSGETMTVTPAVSADRRYVRLSVDAFFNSFNGFTAFNIPAAVGGGGFGGVGGGFAGMNGVIGQGGFGGGGAGFGGAGNGAGGAGFGGPAMGLSGRGFVPAGGQPLAGGSFGPPEGLVKGDPFSLDSFGQDGNKAKPPIPFDQDDAQAGPGFPLPDDAFAEDGGLPPGRGRNRGIRSSRAKNTKPRTTPQRNRSATTRVKPKSTPKTKAQARPRPSSAPVDPFGPGLN